MSKKKKRQTTSQSNNDNNKATLDSIINDTLKNIKSIVDVNTVVGDEVVTSDGNTIIPISKIVVGFVAGGGEINSKYTKAPTNIYPFSGGSGAGFTVVPIGFLIGKKGNLSFVSVKSDTKYDELINLTNKSLKLIIENFGNKKTK